VRTRPRTEAVFRGRPTTHAFAISGVARLLIHTGSECDARAFFDDFEKRV